MNALFYHEHRCQCGKLLLIGVIFDGNIEIKCKKCGTINSIGSIKIIDDATHYLLIIDDRGIITNASDSACRILGYSHDELVGKYFTLINLSLTPEIGKKFFGSESMLNIDNYLKLDTFHQSKEGKKISVSCLFKLYVSTAKEKYILISVKLKNGKHDKKITDENVVEFLDNACDFYYDIDKAGTVECASPSIKNFFCITAEAMVGNNYFNVFPIEAREQAIKKYQFFFSLEQPFRELHNIVVDQVGKTIYNELYFTPRFNDSGKFIGYRVLGWELKNP